MPPLLTLFVFMSLALLAGAGVLHLIPRLGPGGKALSAWLCRAPGLDLMIAYFTVVPMIVGPILGAQYEAAWWGWLAGLGVGVVNVSRHKFEGLVGHDLIWCLYCDWMTGIWSLGTEMLRNVESFWCPIRFDSSKKCANCTIDFPDLDNGWAKANGNMTDVDRVLSAHYPAPNGDNSWFGHPARLTVNGKQVESE